MFVDRATRQAVTNRADAEGHLRADGAVFTGKLPDTVSIANTSTKWAGVDWIMSLWPLPTNDPERRALLMHESWHRIQKDLGFPSTGPGNVHLDTFDGRYWLQLEWRALAGALRQRGDARRQAIEDALVFRAERRSKFKEAANDERLMEMHEGLAEYTGVRLSGLEPAARELYIAGEIDRRPPELPTFVRSFAYLSGPAYGLLLDDAAPDWQRTAKSTDDFGTLLQMAVGIKLSEPSAADLLARSRRYDGDKLRKSEEERDAKRRERIAELKARFVDGPVLSIPLEKMQISFNPSAMQPLEGHGTVYMAARITGTFGILAAPQGALMSPDFKRATVPAPKDLQARPITGDGWSLQLAEGWRLKPGQRKGDWEAAVEKK
jgi:hypothetical protein